MFMFALLEGVKLNAGFGKGTLVWASVGSKSPRPEPPEANTPKPPGIFATSADVITFTSRAPAVASAATVMGTVKEVALFTVAVPGVMPLVPATPGGRENVITLDALKVVFIPVMVTWKLVAPCATPAGATPVMAGNAPLPVHEVAATGMVNWRVAVATGVAESVTVTEKECIPGAFATAVVPNSLPVVLSAESLMLEFPVPPRRFSNTAVSAALFVLHV